MSMYTSKEPVQATVTPNQRAIEILMEILGEDEGIYNKAINMLYAAHPDWPDEYELSSEDADELDDILYDMAEDKHFDKVHDRMTEEGYNFGKTGEWEDAQIDTDNDYDGIGDSTGEPVVADLPDDPISSAKTLEDVKAIFKDNPDIAEILKDAKWEAKDKNNDSRISRKEFDDSKDLSVKGAKTLESESKKGNSLAKIFKHLSSIKY